MRDRDCPAGASPFSAGISDGRVACNAGTIPNSRAAATDVSTVNPSTTGERVNPAVKSMSNGSVIWLASEIEYCAMPSPITPDTTANMRLSMSNWRSSEARVAPRLSRTAISRARSRARARKRFATFTHAINSRIATTAITTADSPTSAERNIGCTPASACGTTVIPDFS